ncbi:MAG: arsenate reductase (glutaredoxin) [Marinicella sp.]
MTKVTIYHNPRCSKSRAALAILEAHKMDIEVINYLETPPSVAELTELVNQLGVEVKSILRKSEADYKAQPFNDPDLSTQDLIQLLHQYPKVMERPIVSYLGQAVICRPPENVLDLIQ